MRLRQMLTVSLGLLVLAFAAPQVQAMREEGLFSSIQAYALSDGTRSEVLADVTDAPPPPDHTTVTKPVDATGGKVDLGGGAALDGGVTLNVPPGAFGQPVTLTVSSTSAPPSGLNPPSGTIFINKTFEITGSVNGAGGSAQPSRTLDLTINLTAADLTGHNVNRLQAGVVFGDSVETRPTTLVNATDGILNLSIDHFTKFTVFEAIVPGPAITAPESGATLSSLSANLAWTAPPNATQYQLQVVPFAGDGPAINLIGNIVTGFTVPAPPEWYGLLPDTTYIWRVRTTGVSSFPVEAQWGPWATRSFRTPKGGTGSISPAAPPQGATVDTLTPTLAWTNTQPGIFYYEVQVSKDPTFNTDPATATAMVYQELRHGGVTTPKDSYTVPGGFPLEPGLTYYWRVRPRIQGDGTPLPWPDAFSFKTQPATPPPAAPTPAPGLSPTPAPAG